MGFIKWGSQNDVKKIRFLKLGFENEVLKMRFKKCRNKKICTGIYHKRKGV